MPTLAHDLDPGQLSLSPSEGYLLSRVDGCTPWHLLRDIGGLPPEEVDRCLERWISEGVLVLSDGRQPGRATMATLGKVVTATDAGDAIDSSLEIPVDTQRRILDFERGLDRPYHEILGVASNAARGAIKKAYFGLSKEFHPDRYFRREIGGYAARLERIFKKIVEAYELLSDPMARAELERSLAPAAAVPESAPQAAGGAVASGADRPRRRTHVFSIHRRVIEQRRLKAKRLFESGMAAFVRERWMEAGASVRLAIAFDPWNEVYKERFVEVQLKVHAERAAELVRQAEDALDLRDYADALRLFEEALHYRPHDADLLYRTARLAWLSANDLHRAKEYAMQATELLPEVAAYRRTLGQIYKAAGLRANARRELEAALHIDPNDTEAEEELRSLSGRLRARQWLGGKR